LAIHHVIDELLLKGAPPASMKARSSSVRDCHDSKQAAMNRSFYHEHPNSFALETQVIAQRPGAVALAKSPFYPGGGGQLPDRGVLRWSGGEAEVIGFEEDGSTLWHRITSASEVSGAIEAIVDSAFRHTMCQLHTNLHVLNALVFQTFAGALVTGVQMSADGTARIDFDLPDANNERLRGLEPAINDAIRHDLPVFEEYVALETARGEPGVLRSRSVSPPPLPDGTVRVVEIKGLDRQACGGTHLASTGQSKPVRIIKVDNKGRHNRRVRIGLVEPE
jgi:misacylated tRNA(Ala) deacylase